MKLGNEHQPVSFSITQLKFRSECYEKDKKTKSTFTPSISMHNWNKNFVVRQQHRKQRPISHEHFGLPEQIPTETKNNLFMAWKERNLSHLRLQATTARSFAEAFSSLRKSQSERKMTRPPEDLEYRRLTALPKQRPLQAPELIAQKLQWQERVKRRINPTARIKQGRQRPALGEKSVVMRLSGWDYGQSQFEQGL